MEKAWLPGSKITLKLSDLAWSPSYVPMYSLVNIVFFVNFSFAEHH